MIKTYDPKKTTDQVRQGNGRLMNTRVLIWSLSGIVIAFVLVFIAFFVFGHTPPAA